MLMRNRNMTVFWIIVGALFSFLFAQVQPVLGQDTEIVPKVKKASKKKKKTEKEPTVAELLSAAGNIDTVESAVNKLGFDYVSGTEGVDVRAPKPKPRKPYLGDFTGNTLMCGNGLIEIPTPNTTPRGKFQVGAQYIHRRLQISPSLQLNARVMFQTLSFGLLKNVEAGFGSSGYYKSSNNTTYFTTKVRLTNPEKSKIQIAAGIQSIDFGSSSVSNQTNYFGTASFDLNGSKIYLNMLNDGNNKYSNITVRGGAMIQLRELIPQPSCLIVEAIQDVNNNFSRYNFGIRTAVSDNALFDLFLMKDININELSPAVGVNLKF